MRGTEGGRRQLGVHKFSLKVGGFQAQLKETSLKKIFRSSREEKGQAVKPLRGCCVL